MTLSFTCIATLMQPLQYDARLSAAKDKSITHAAAAPSNLDAAITMRFAASRGKHASLYAHGNKTWHHSCSHYTAICNHGCNKRIEARTHEQPHVAKHQGRTDSTMKRAQRHPPHTRGTFHRRPTPLYTEKDTVSCSGFLPKTNAKSHATLRAFLFCEILLSDVLFCEEKSHTTPPFVPFFCVMYCCVM